MMLPFVAAVVQMLLPGVTGVLGQVESGTASQMRCGTVVAQQTVNNATALAGFVTVGDAAGSVSFSVYPDSDAGALLLFGQTNAPTAVGVVAGTGQAATTFTAGTKYRVCTCSTSTTIQYLSVRQPGTSAGDLVGVLDGGAFPTTVGTAANACTGAAPPSTTGALTAATSFKLPIVLVSQ